ncbi:acyltransferase [Stutzerimonas kunmingensis]|uniref:acyltransferase n=1 Tax=Stutzerimonas kunmingensis TaxID=1211807 RepID=UPI00241DE46A|nr:acyltransferase [Stutzerimonas kunmingensis]
MERLAHIDALRGSAALLLIFQTLLLPLSDGWALQHALDPGLLAVLWFLLCCGFIVPASLHTSVDGGRGFVVRRLLRLLPVYLLAVALLLALARQLLGTELPVTLPLALSLMFFASLRYEAKHESSSYARRRAREYARYTLRIYLLVLPIIFLAGWSADATAWPRDLLTYALAIVTFLLVTSRLPLRAPPLVWLGSLSYSLYLLLPAMQRLSELLPQALGLTGPTASLAGAVFGLLLALGSAQLCRQFLDLPLAHAGRRLTRQHDLMPLARLHSR